MEVQLKNLGVIITGNTPSKQEQSFWNSDDICFVKPDLICDNGIEYIVDSKEYISEEARKKARIVAENTILVTCIGSIGKIGIAKRECAFNQQINAIVTNKRVLPKYLAYCLLYNRNRLIEIANAPVVPIVNKSQFGELCVSIEDNTNYQEEIVDILDRVSVVVDARRQELQKLDELVKARFVEMFGGCKNMVSMNDLCSIITDGTHQPPKFQDSGIPFIFVSNLANNSITFDAVKYISEETYSELYKRTPIEIGDLLLSTVGSYGHPAVVVEDRKFLFQRHIAYLKPKHDIVNSIYLHSALLAPDGQRQIEEKVKGIAQKTLNLSEIRKIMIPIPIIEEQNEFEQFVKRVDKSKAVVQEALDEAQLLFDSLMQQYFG